MQGGGEGGVQGRGGREQETKEGQVGVSSKRGVNQGGLAVITISWDMGKFPNGSYLVLQIPMILPVHCYSLPNATFVQPYQEQKLPINRQPTSAKL